MCAKTKALGRGLGAIFELENVKTPEKKTVSMMEEIPLMGIRPNPAQPREVFDEEALNELADSIRALGVIQPITVRLENDGKYTIISGERRWRAAQLADLESIPAYIREADDQNLHEMALVENLQRKDLNAMEVAIGLQRLIDEFDLTQDMLSARVGKKRSTIANYMRLLNLPVEVQSAIRDEYIAMGHAKAIASAPEELQLNLLKRTVRNAMSVRQVEKLAKQMAEELNKPKEEKKEEEEYPESYGELVMQLEAFFSQDISIKRDRSGGGQITINFTDDEEIDGFITKFKAANKEQKK